VIEMATPRTQDRTAVAPTRSANLGQSEMRELELHQHWWQWLSTIAAPPHQQASSREPPLARVLSARTKSP